MIAKYPSKTAFEYQPFGTLYARALRDVTDRRLDGRERKTAARTLAFLLREGATERTATDALSVLHQSLDMPYVVRTLLLGLRDVASHSGQITAWTIKVADCTATKGHLPSFVSTMRLLVDLHDFDGTVPTFWRLSILRAVEVPQLAPRVLLVTKAYAGRFPAESWRWVREARRRSTVVSLRRGVTIAEMREARES